jgi:hypothetical protein
MSGTNASVLEAADALLGMMDENALLPEDEGFVEPEETEEVVEDKAADSSDQEEATSEDDVDEDGESEEEGDEEATDSDQEAKDQLFEVTIGDEVYEVNLPELQAGYLRNEEYTRRLTELEQEHQSKMESLDDDRAKLLSALEDVLATAASELGQFKNINWDKLRKEDPDRYKDLRLAFMEAQERADAQSQQRKALQEGLSKVNQLKREAYYKAQSELAKQLMPDFGKPEFDQALLNYGKQIGLTQEEVESIADARYLQIFDKARRYDELQVKKKEVVEKKVSKDLPPVVKPGAPKAEGQERRSKVKAARAQLGKSGSITDAANLFLARGVFD